MKKKLILAGIAAIMGVSGFYGYSAATAGSGLSGRGMENASILSDPEIIWGYSTCCTPGEEKDWCCINPYSVIDGSKDCDDAKINPDPEEEQP